MDYHRIDADRLQQRHVRGEILGRLRPSHGMAAIFHDEHRARVTLQIGQRLGQRFGLGEEGGIGRVAHHWRALERFGAA